MRKRITAILFMYMQIELYNYNGNVNTVNKTLPTGNVINGAIWDRFSICNPVVNVKSHTLITANYCKIEKLNRYYFIDKVVYRSCDKWELQLRVDVLKTYATQILQATATVTVRDNPNKYVSNRNNVYNRKPNFEKIDFPKKGLFNKDGSIIMITIKGNK